MWSAAAWPPTASLGSDRSASAVGSSRVRGRLRPRWFAVQSPPAAAGRASRVVRLAEAVAMGGPVGGAAAGARAGAWGEGGGGGGAAVEAGVAAREGAAVQAEAGARSGSSES